MSELGKIGICASEQFDMLEEIVTKARQPEFPEIDVLFSSAIEKMRAGCVRLSVVGQVKAGKSSLINALTGMRDFLPTEVNPWTAVITNLNFGYPGKPTSGGAFLLFSDGEWERMLEGDAETRKLAEELLPGFSSGLLREQVEEMRETAKKRLGGLYHHLLGKTHSFNTITPELLERYVSAGYADGENADSSAGKFSGITKFAEVFFPMEPFAIPATVSDTPGINDPFLVRDEITTRSFQHADIFVVALSVHQALNTADIALLKMLSVHKGKKTLIFVNRIDQLDDPVQTVPEVLQALDERLQEELDDGDYTLIAGSAVWGGLASSGSDDDLEAAARSDAFRSYREHLEMDDSSSLREKFYAISGFRDLALAIDGLITNGPAKSILQEAVSEVSSSIMLLRNMLEERLSREASSLVDTDDIPAVIAQEKKRISQRVGNLSDLQVSLKKAADAGHNQLLGNGDVVFKSVMKAIDAAVTAYVEAQSRNLREAFSQDGTKSRWTLETGDIRSRVEQQVTESYRNGRTELDGLLQKHADSINEIIRPLAGDIQIDRILDSLPHDDIFPGFKPASTLVEVELVNERGWKFWKRSEMSADEAVNRVKSVIRAELYSSIEALRKVARQSIAERTGAALERLNGLIDASRQMVASEIESLENDAAALAEGDAGETLQRIKADREERAAQRRKSIEALKEAELALHENFGTLAKAHSANQSRMAEPPALARVAER